MGVFPPLGIETPQFRKLVALEPSNTTQLTGNGQILQGNWERRQAAGFLSVMIGCGTYLNLIFLSPKCDTLNPPLSRREIAVPVLPSLFGWPLSLNPCIKSLLA
jgi:hypothetical protein